MELHRGRLIDHVHLVVRNIWSARKFYSAVLGELGVPIEREGNGWFSADELYVTAGKVPGARVRLALSASDRQSVDRFYRAGLAAGGSDNGPPGERPYHAEYYSAHLLDPDGNSIEAVTHGPLRRTAESVIIRRDG
ncbi:MAG: VOC family protein [Alphaproteobacteria bacterium]